MASNIPQNTTCYDYYNSPALNLTGFVLMLSISKCLEEQEAGTAGRGVAEFVMKVANEYFTDTKQVIVLYDESWEINDMVEKLTVTVTKSFILYFLPLDNQLASRINSKPPDDESHKKIPKANSFVVFVKDENGFSNILRLMSEYPWWNIRARLLVLVKEKALEPTKGILTLMESERMFSGVVVTEVAVRENATAIAQSEILDEKAALTTALQIAALDPYPAPGQPTQFFVGRYADGKLNSLRPIFMDKTDNLRGFKLRVCVYVFPPLVVKEEISPGKFRYSGLEISILDQLANYINFTYEIYESKVEERYGMPIDNTSWNGLIGEVADNRAQIGFGSVFLLDNREKAVDVTDPYDQDRGCFGVPSPEALQHWLGLVLPFSWQVWACFVAMALVAGPMFSGITRPLKMDASISIGRGIMYALGSMVSAQQSPKANSSSLRAFIIAWLIFCWLSCIIYRVALIVSLTLGPSDYKIDSMDQLARSGLEWGGYEEVLKTFSNTTSKVDQKLYERFLPITNITAALDRVAQDGDFAVLESAKFLQFASKVTYFDGYSSALYITKECPTTYNVGFIMPVGSPYYERVNSLLRRFQNAGLIDKWLRDIMFEAVIKNPNLKRKGIKTYGLTLNHLKLCFVLVLFGHFFGGVACTVERAVESYKRKQILRDKIRKQSRISGLSIKSASPSILIDDPSED